MIKQYPNPANQSATFEFSVTEDQNVSVNILNINGQVVGSIYNGSVRANEVNKLDYNVTTLQKRYLLCSPKYAFRCIKEKVCYY